MWNCYIFNDISVVSYLGKKEVLEVKIKVVYTYMIVKNSILHISKRVNDILIINTK